MPLHRIPSRWRLPALALRLAVPLVLACLLLTACAFGGGGQMGASSSPRAHTAAASTAAAAVRRAHSSTRVRFASVTLTVPPGTGGEPFDVPRKLTLPVGWTATVWARVSDARFAVWTPQHDLLVSSSESGRVVELIPGRNPSGPARLRVLISGLTGPQGLAFDTLKGARVLYVAESDEIDRYVWKRTGTVGARTVVVSGLPDTDPTGDDVHRAKSIAIGPDHTIYVTAGSASNATPVTPGESPPRATILSVRPDGSDLRVFASGVRNGEGLSFAPDGTLWTAVNERDEIAFPFHRPYESISEAFGRTIPAYVANHPPDELARLLPGRNLGWPYCDPDPDGKPGVAGSPLRYADLPFNPDAQTNPGGSVFDCATLAPIERGLPAHSAPLGFHFLEGSAIAAPWAHGAVVAVHGSWDREPPRAPAVLWLPWESPRRTLGESIPLVSGFQLPSGERWGRPADAVVGPEGALYVTDDTAGAVYRIGPPAR
jgi:glucose/arabinose dehydrogenase